MTALALRASLRVSEIASMAIRFLRRDFAKFVLLLAIQGPLLACTLSVLYAAAEAQDGSRATSLPLRSFRLCNTGPLAPYGADELNPADMSAKVTDPSWIVDASVLAVRISYPDGACGSDCRRKVADAFVSALNLWRQQCLRCGVGIFAFVIVDDIVYVEQNIARMFTDLLVPLEQRIVNSHQVLLGLTGDRPSGDGHVFGSYVRLERTDRSIADFCTRRFGESFRQLWPGRFKSAACNDSDPTASPPLATIKFVEAPPCGKAEFIACGKRDYGIEMDLENTAYVFRDDPTAVSVGEAPILLGAASAERVDIEAVFIHEIGHYLGLGHLQTKNLPARSPAVMLDTLDDDSCLSLAETMMLNSAASRGWRYRVEPCAGLRRRPVSKR